MKLRSILGIAALFFIKTAHGDDCINKPLLCKREGQLCMRWNGQVGWCRTVYDIKGNASRSCEPLEVDRFGYPDRGFFWPRRQRDTLFL